MIISNDSKAINTESKYISQILNSSNNSNNNDLERKSLMDYLIISEKDTLGFKDYTYSNYEQQVLSSSKTNITAVGNLQRYVENVNSKYTYDINKVNRNEEMLSENNGKCFKINMDKVNYLINFYTKNGGDMSKYPFNESEEWIEEAYKDLALQDGNSAIIESRIKSVISKSELTEVSFSIDAKGSIKIEANDEIKADILLGSLSSIKNDLQIFLKQNGDYFKGMSQESKGIFARNWDAKIGLNNKYGITIESLKIESDGSISGLPEEAAALCKENYIYEGNIKNAIKAGGSSDEIIGTFTYKNGDLYIA